MKYSRDSETLIQLDYKHNNSGGITARTETRKGYLPVRYDYIFDSVGRLIQTNINGIKSSAFEYDPLGNRTKWEFDVSRYASSTLGNTLKPEVSYDIIEYGYDSGNRIVSAGGSVFRHDENGNLTDVITSDDGRGGDGSKSSTVYGYNRAGKMYKITNPDKSGKEYGYDASGMRIREVLPDGVTREFFRDNGGVPVFQSERLAGLGSSNGSIPAVSYIYSGVSPIAANVRTSIPADSANTKTVYFLDDHLGSILALTDENGNIITHYNYDEFGIMTAKREILPNPLTTQPGATGFPGYTGQYQDQTAGLLYLRNRFYNLAIGRFTQIDPIYPDNQYAYIPEGNPVGYTDVMGLIPAWLIIAKKIATVIGGCLPRWAIYRKMQDLELIARGAWAQYTWDHPDCDKSQAAEDKYINDYITRESAKITFWKLDTHVANWVCLLAIIAAI